MGIHNYHLGIIFLPIYENIGDGSWHWVYHVAWMCIPVSQRVRTNIYICIYNIYILYIYPKSDQWNITEYPPPPVSIFHSSAEIPGQHIIDDCHQQQWSQKGSELDRGPDLGGWGWGIHTAWGKMMDVQHQRWGVDWGKTMGKTMKNNVSKFSEDGFRVAEVTASSL